MLLERLIIHPQLLGMTQEPAAEQGTTRPHTKAFCWACIMFVNIEILWRILPADPSGSLRRIRRRRLVSGLRHTQREACGALTRNIPVFSVSDRVQTAGIRVTLYSY